MQFGVQNEPAWAGAFVTTAAEAIRSITHHPLTERIPE